MLSTYFFAEIIVTSDELVLLLAIFGGAISMVTAGGAIIFRGISRLHTILGRVDNRIDKLERDINAAFMLQRRDRNIIQLQINHVEQFLEHSGFGYVSRSFDSLFEDEYRDRDNHK